MSTMMFALADELKAKREEKKGLEAEVKALGAEIEAIEADLSDLMVEEEIQRFDRAGQLFYLSTRTMASAKAEDKDALFAWLKQNGYGDLVKEQVNAQSLNSFAKELLAEADQLPEGLEGLLNIYEKTTVSVRKAAK